MQQYKVIIVGTGFAGICLGIKLKELGINNLLFLEKAEEVGGTWRENIYPGAECDVPSALYSYSFEQNSNWSCKWANQSEIHEYQINMAKKYALYEHIQFSQNVVKAIYDEELHLWQIDTSTGERYLCQHFVSAIGQLHYPSIPAFNNDHLYKGDLFHSARWNSDIDLNGKEVAVIGNAASALQFIPEIAKQVKQLTVFQRSPNWIIAKPNRSYWPWEKWLLENVPFFMSLKRLALWLRGEWVLLPAIRKNPLARWVLKNMCLWNMKKYINDPELVNKLTPDYPMGAKRILFSDNYYETLARDNVSLDTSGVESFTEEGIKSKDGEVNKFDAIIYGTGFKTNPFFASIHIQGLDGLSIRDSWEDGAQAYLGVSTKGFPNLHMMYGPNTNLGHNSIIIMLEAQARYIAQCIENMEQAGISAISVKPEVEATYNEEIQARLNNMAFSEIDQSWYMDRGRITQNWAGSTSEYMRRLRHFDLSAYQVLG